MSWSQILAALVAAFVVTQIAIFTTTVYLHRSLTHRALTLHPVAAFPCRVVIWMTTGMRPREWVAVHRKHHAATDTADDPHSPLIVGFWRVQLGNVGLYKRAARDNEMVRKYARDIPTDGLDRLAFDYSLVGLGIGIAILVVSMWALGFGLLTGLVAAGLHAVLYVMLAGAINAVGHQYGTRPYRNSATNLRPLAIVTGGEGLHNNHHAAPTSARFSLHRGELDPGWWVVRALTAVRLAHVRHDDVHLKPVASP
jgi:stearoyl-CoA desaturase (Delta-9 desaturase)